MRKSKQAGIGAARYIADALEQIAQLDTINAEVRKRWLTMDSSANQTDPHELNKQQVAAEMKAFREQNSQKRQSVMDSIQRHKQ
ncbi:MULTISPECIES: hypothetical protein [unclassified Caballeronia]|uniref:hypothetical protein n=1 Tax=unclassified Caballeronia TaxID=2646786 RepID=UPI002856B18C|nr:MULTISPECIES: hypothetical protein [unclassified Caballeronia]MDR5751134.1 hypothetical protein [Caballeronia sp. LZ024]MDR5844729.1 hypothetical protein [Caballeronia sp. LZ031]